MALKIQEQTNTGFKFCYILVVSVPIKRDLVINRKFPPCNLQVQVCKNFHMISLIF